MSIINMTRSELDSYDDLSMRLYLVNDMIYKLMRIYEKSGYEEDIKEFYQLIDFLKKDTIFTELVKPKDILRIKDYMTTRFGYTMDYLEDYETLENNLYISSLKRKKSFYYAIANILKRINEHNIVYDDIHDNNIMVDKYSDEIKFIDPDSVKVLGLNTKDIESNLHKEKERFTELVLKGIYNNDFYFNYYLLLSDKFKGLQVSNDLLDYIKDLENNHNPTPLITDFSDDMSKDVIRFNRKIINKRSR